MNRPEYREGPFNVVYDTPRGLAVYCQLDMDLRNAAYFLDDFERRYIDPETGKGKPFSNGRGVHEVSNPRIARRGPNGGFITPKGEALELINEYKRRLAKEIVNG